MQEPNVNARDSYGNTALTYVEQSESVKALIKAGAEVNSNNKDGFTPLMNAAQHDRRPPNVDNIKILLKAGANVNAKDDSGKTALMYASETRRGYGQSQFICADIVKELIKSGANVNIRDEWGGTALMYVAESLAHAYYTSTQDYFAYGIVINVGDEVINTVKALIKAKANVNIRDRNGQTALINAVKLADYDSEASKHALLETLNLLTKARADVNIRDNYGKTALDYAIELELGEEVQKLLRGTKNSPRK